MVRFVRDYTVEENVQHDNIDEVVRIVNDPLVTRERVKADLKTGICLSRWVLEFGTMIFQWDAFGVDISKVVSFEQFDDMIRLLREHPAKQDQIRKKLELLRRRDVDVPLPTPGGDFKTPYWPLFQTDAYKNLPYRST